MQKKVNMLDTFISLHPVYYGLKVGAKHLGINMTNATQGLHKYVEKVTGDQGLVMVHPLYVKL